MKVITQLSQLDLNGTYSYVDYLTWRLEEGVELFKGKIMTMSPAPNVKHQRVAMKLLRPTDQYFLRHSCELFSMVQPDLCVICDKDKLSKQGCDGAPDWIIEILLPGQQQKRSTPEIRFVSGKWRSGILDGLSL